MARAKKTEKTLCKLRYEWSHKCVVLQSNSAHCQLINDTHAAHIRRNTVTELRLTDSQRHISMSTSEQTICGVLSCHKSNLWWQMTSSSLQEDYRDMNKQTGRHFQGPSNDGDVTFSKSYSNYLTNHNFWCWNCVTYRYWFPSGDNVK